MSTKEKRKKKRKEKKEKREKERKRERERKRKSDPTGCSILRVFLSFVTSTTRAYNPPN